MKTDVELKAGYITFSPPGVSDWPIEVKAADVEVGGDALLMAESAGSWGWTQATYDEIMLPTNTTSYTLVRTYTTNITTSLHTNQFETSEDSGTYRCTVIIQRNPAPLEAVILPDPPPLSRLPNYASWIPLGGSDENTPGTNFFVRVILRQKGSQDTVPFGQGAAQFTFHLNDVSREPGICMNYPPQGQVATPPSPDLRFSKSDDFTITDEDLTATTVRGDLNEQGVIINSFDYGAWGKLTVTANIPGQGEVKAYVLDHPEQDFLTLPKDDNMNHVADAWEKIMGVYNWNLTSDWDKNSSPSGQKSDGDGISFYEEYRGFRCKGKYDRLDPHIKSLFIYDPDGLVLATLAAGPGVPNIGDASGVQSHLIWDKEWSGYGFAGAKCRVVNFNTSGFAHITDQHGVEIYIGKAVPNRAASKSAYDLQCATTYPDDTFDGPGGPGDTKASVIRPWIIEQNMRFEVRYHTQGLDLFKNMNAPYLSAADKKALEQLLDKTTDDFIASHPADKAQALLLRTSQVVTHELGHNINTYDHEPFEGGDHSCIMRYLPVKDFQPDPTDRFCLQRRTPWPSKICDAGTCRPRIQISDYPGKAGCSSLATHRLKSSSDSTSLPRHASGVHTLSDTINAPQPFELSAEIGWSPVYAGDPLELTLRLDAVQLQQQLADQLAAQSNSDSNTVSGPCLSADWPEGCALTLTRLETNGQRLIILGTNDWQTFIRPVAIDFAALGIQATVYSREWLVSGTSAQLAPGNYELAASWNGQGWPETNRPSGFNGLTIAPLLFTVIPTASSSDQAAHLGRLAIIAGANGQWDFARSLGSQAIALDETFTNPEQVDTCMVAAEAAFQQQDYMGAYQALSPLANQPDVNETVSLAEQERNSLAPQLSIQRILPSFKPQITIQGWPGQTVISEFSDDLARWNPFGTNQLDDFGQFILTNLPPVSIKSGYFRTR